MFGRDDMHSRFYIAGECDVYHFNLYTFSASVRDPINTLPAQARNG